MFVYSFRVVAPLFLLYRHFKEESEKFLSDSLLPNLVWRGGRTASAVRTAALSSLLALLHGGSLTPGQVRKHISALPGHESSPLVQNTDQSAETLCSD